MSNIKLFESKRIRSHWDAEEEKWYFAIADTIAILTDSPNPQVLLAGIEKKTESRRKSVGYKL